MRSKVQNDRITEEADWKDGMNSFRQYVRGEIQTLKDRIIELEREINRSNYEREDSETI